MTKKILDFLALFTSTALVDSVAAVVIANIAVTMVAITADVDEFCCLLIREPVVN